MRIGISYEVRKRLGETGTGCKNRLDIQRGRSSRISRIDKRTNYKQIMGQK